MGVDKHDGAIESSWITLIDIAYVFRLFIQNGPFKISKSCFIQSPFRLNHQSILHICNIVKNIDF